MALEGCVDKKNYAPSEIRTLGVAVVGAKSGLREKLRVFSPFLSKKATKGQKRERDMDENRQKD